MAAKKKLYSINVLKRGTIRTKLAGEIEVWEEMDHDLTPIGGHTMRVWFDTKKKRDESLKALAANYEKERSSDPNFPEVKFIAFDRMF